MDCGHWSMNFSCYAFYVLRLVSSSRYPQLSLPSITSNLLFSNSGFTVSGLVHSAYYPHVTITQALCYVDITLSAITQATKRLPAHYKVTIYYEYCSTPICENLTFAAICTLKYHTFQSAYTALFFKTKLHTFQSACTVPGPQCCLLLWPTHLLRS